MLQLSESRPFTLVIDEFQNFQKVNPTVFSDMQRETDGNYYNLKGQHVAKPGKGVYIYKGRKIMR